MTMKAIVASGHQYVSQTAIDIIKRGGNAFDAAVAAGFSSAICEPTLTSLGGGGFLLARTSLGEEILFDFFTNTPGKGVKKDFKPYFFPVTVKFPGSEQVFNVGHGSVAVPGTLKGLIHVHKRLGRLPLSDVLEPAIYLCENGVELNWHQAYFLKLLEPIMTLTQEAKRLFSPNGKLLKEGDRLFNNDLALFLKRLSEDEGEEFYKGEISKKIEKDMEENGGLLTSQDLASYEVIERKPLEFFYKDKKILTNPPPSLGGGLICLSLEIFDKFDCKCSWLGTDHIEALGSTLFKVEELREKGILMPSSIKDVTITHVINSKGTTHLSICDRDGNVASMTTSNGEGSGYIVPGTGIMLNNMMGEDDLHPNGFHCQPPGLRVSSMMSPSVVVSEDGAINLVIGSGGSKRIRAAIFQVLTHVVDFSVDIKNAVYAPRLFWDGQLFQVEPGLSQNSIDVLKKRWPINLWDKKDIYFGGVHALIPGKEGAGDPRRGGFAIGF